MSATTTRKTFAQVSPAAPSAVVLGALTNIARCDNVSVIWTSLGATGGPLDLYVQAKDGGGNWYDVAHFPQVAAAAGASTRQLSISRVNTKATSTVTGDKALAADTVVHGDFGDQLQFVLVAGASTSAGAAQTVSALASRTAA